MNTVVRELAAIVVMVLFVLAVGVALNLMVPTP